MFTSQLKLICGKHLTKPLSVQSQNENKKGRFLSSLSSSKTDVNEMRIVSVRLCLVETLRPSVLLLLSSSQRDVMLLRETTSGCIRHVTSVVSPLVLVKFKHKNNLVWSVESRVEVRCLFDPQNHLELLQVSTMTLSPLWRLRS